MDAVPGELAILSNNLWLSENPTHSTNPTPFMPRIRRECVNYRKIMREQQINSATLAEKRSRDKARTIRGGEAEK